MVSNKIYFIKIILDIKLKLSVVIVKGATQAFRLQSLCMLNVVVSSISVLWESADSNQCCQKLGNNAWNVHQKAVTSTYTAYPTNPV